MYRSRDINTGVAKKAWSQNRLRTVSWSGPAQYSPELPRGHLALLAKLLILKLPISASSKLDNP